MCCCVFFVLAQLDCSRLVLCGYTRFLKVRELTRSEQTVLKSACSLIVCARHREHNHWRARLTLSRTVGDHVTGRQ